MMNEEAGVSPSEQTEVVIKTMATGGKHSLVLGADGSLFSFGYGQ